jgi:F5/8 type C domain
MKAVLWCIAALMLASGLNLVYAQEYNPKPGWKDSYAVGGKCYCDSNGYDHNLDTKTVQTPQGRKNVVEVCEAITRVLGTGSSSGRIPYNDIQCGNGPANDAPDEAGCPGRVDIGPSGCNQIGPKWDLESVYGSNPSGSGTLPRNGWKASASSNSGDAARAFDSETSTRWATGQTQRSGQFFQIDLGKPSSFDSIELNAAGNAQDYPRSYRVLVSDDGKNLHGPVTTGQGVGAVTEIDFSPQTARYVRIEQNGSDDTRWWSIADVQLRLGGNTSGAALNSKGWALFASSDPANTGSAVDGATGSRWATRTVQSPGQFFQIDMQKMQRFNRIVLASEGNPFDYPRGYKVLVSNDGVQWGSAVASGAGDSATTTISFPARTARYIRIEQTGSHSSHWWSIHELSVLAAD